ncbi:MAG: hypothetical protein HY959_00570 [Ignavibacteriae bacterium]|nr:hypothetical protein [Ignavibacteriota bacterium]
MENYEEKIQDKYLDSIRKESYKESFNDVGNWLRREAAHASSAPAKKNYAFFRFVFSEGRMKFAYLFIILILAGITSNFSVTRSEMVGSVMSWTIDKQKTEAIKKIDNLDWIDKSQLVVEESKTDNGTVLTYKMLMPTANTNEIESYKTQLANIKEIMTIDIQPISEPVKQPLYAVAMEKIFNYDYDKNYANPEEIKNSVYEQLKYAGLGNYVGFNFQPNGVAGKTVSFNIAEPESVRIRIHDDIVYNYDLDRALEEMENIITPIKYINDSVIKKMIVRINGENINPGAVLYEVHRSLDTLHLRLKHGDINRKEKIERFNLKMEKFNESMEKFNKKMEKFNEQMEEYQVEMEDYQESLEELKNLPKLDFDFEIPEAPEVDVDVDVEIPEIPEFDENSFKFNFNYDELDKNIKILVDSLKINIDAEKMEKMGKKYEEKMKKFEEKMKRYEKDLQEKYKNTDSVNLKRIYEIENDEEANEPVKNEE